MSVQRKFREILGIQAKSTFIQLQPELLTAVKKIAARDGRTISEVANDMIHFALYEDHVAQSSLQTWQLLTPREREITALIWLGMTNPQIAQRLLISPNTVKTHIKNILSKFDVHSKKSLADLLTGLDLSDWTDLATPDFAPPSPVTPTPTDSPPEVSP
jgi:DNA-binding NarL/FixJ family response regulator